MMTHPAYEIPAAIVLVAAFMLPWISTDVRRLLSIAGFVIFLAGDIVTRQWGAVVLDVVVIGVIAWQWWRRGRGKRAAKILGAKSRALRDALVRKVRESARPRPGLQPVPVSR